MSDPFFDFLSKGIVPQNYFKKKTKTRKNVEDEKIIVNTSTDSIFHIDSLVKKKIRESMSRVSELEDDLKNMKNFNVDKDSQKMITKRMNDLSCAFSYFMYSYKTQEIIEEYRKIFDEMPEDSFYKTKDEISESRDYKIKLEKISMKYFEISSDYLDITIGDKFCCDIHESGYCPDCKSSNTDFLDETTIICNECNQEINILDTRGVYKDSDRITVTNKYSYNGEGQFTKAINCYQGIQNVDMTKIKSVIEILKEQMKIGGLVAEQDLNNSVTKDDIYSFLSTKKLSEHYDDLNLIFYIITGVKCPDISSIIQDLYEDFYALQKVLDKKSGGKRNNYSVYKLFKLLQKRGFPCSRNDFYVLKTQEKEDECIKKLKEAYDELGWVWTPTH